MGIVVERVSNKLSDRMRGQGVIVRRELAKNPFQKKQWIRATVIIKPATFTEKAVIKEELFFLPFMEAIRLAQSRYPKMKISYTTLAITAAQKEPAPAAEKKLE